MLVRGSLLAIAVTLSAFGGVRHANAQAVFTLSSPDFKDGARLATKNAGNNKSNPNCVGENVSPELSWANPPAGTKSFVLLMEDPEGRAPAGVHHMVTYGIDAKVTGFAEGELSKPSDKFVGGKATQGTGIYNGPCTPANVQPHHYTFTLIATDLDPKELPPGLTRPELTDKLVPASGPAPHIKGSAGIVGLFVKPAN